LGENRVRGFHLQAKPHAEAKLVQCIAGRIFDDLRPGSPTYGRHHAVELSPAGGRMLYVPEECAHGFQTLVTAVRCSTASFRPTNRDPNEACA
jgi:dTDP-4-dehydrorhamnose 3,5-epimerase-like enzyme